MGNFPNYMIFWKGAQFLPQTLIFYSLQHRFYKEIGVRKSKIVSKTQFLSIFSRIYCCDGVNNVKTGTIANRNKYKIVRIVGK